tara:strand:- start:448 stop:924 length:477 start_codon:yes stop_codon:yes gene_type:complete
MDIKVEKMIEDNQKLVYKIANSMYIKNKLFSKEDLIQEGLLSLCRSGHKYDETRGKVSTFITHCVRNDMIKFIKKNKLQPDLLYSENTKLSYNLDKDFDCLDYYDLCGARTDTEKNVVEMKLKGYTNKKISKELNVSANKVSKIIKAMKERMEKNEKK